MILMLWDRRPRRENSGSLLTCGGVVALLFRLTAGYFSCFAKKSNQKKATLLPRPLRGLHLVRNAERGRPETCLARYAGEPSDIQAGRLRARRCARGAVEGGEGQNLRKELIW